MKIHSSIKKSLGYPIDMSDKDFKKAWKKRVSHVCKPCWELKYCPYGPFVEQSPILPSEREGMKEHIAYLSNCIETGYYGSEVHLNEERIDYYKKVEEIANDEIRILIPFVYDDMRIEGDMKYAEEENISFEELYKPPLEKFETYDVPFPFEEDKSLYDKVMELEITPDLQERLDKKLKSIKQIIATGIDDNRKPLEPKRREYFEKIVANHNDDEYPENIPDYVAEMSCNIFGHICPVVFVGESISETSELRRRGRYIPFKTKMRVVRRDNYTCQHCSKHLQDDEVEFDHIIPVAKGGSSEEHNIRLTCFDCNRDKSDNVRI